MDKFKTGNLYFRERDGVPYVFCQTECNDTGENFNMIDPMCGVRWAYKSEKHEKFEEDGFVPFAGKVRIDT